MEKSAMSEEKQRVWYQLRCQPYADSDEGILLNYLLNHPVYDSKEAAFKAFKAFWKALAYQKTGTASSEQIHQLGWHCIDALLNHVDYLCASLELNRQQLGALLIARGCAHHPKCAPYFLGLKYQAESASQPVFPFPTQREPISKLEEPTVESDDFAPDTDGFNLTNFDPAMLGPTFS